MNVHRYTCTHAHFDSIADMKTESSEVDTIWTLNTSWFSAYVVWIWEIETCVALLMRAKFAPGSEPRIGFMYFPLETIDLVFYVRASLPLLGNWGSLLTSCLGTICDPVINIPVCVSSLAQFCLLPSLSFSPHSASMLFICLFIQRLEYWRSCRSYSKGNTKLDLWTQNGKLPECQKWTLQENERERVESYQAVSSNRPLNKVQSGDILSVTNSSRKQCAFIYVCSDNINSQRERVCVLFSSGGE